MNMEELRNIANAVPNGEWVKQPTPVEIVGTTFGNEIQTKILSTLKVSNLLVFYLCAFATLRYFLVGN